MTTLRGSSKMSHNVMAPGDVIKVKSWPDTLGQRFVVVDIVVNESSKWPNQVFVTSKDGQFRAFPAELCKVVKPRARKASTSG